MGKHKGRTMKTIAASIFFMFVWQLCALAQAGLSYTVTPKITDYGASFGGDFTIKNTGTEPIKDWVLEFDWNQTFTVWSATKTSVGTKHTIKNSGWNGTIAAGASVTFGFNGSGAKIDDPKNYVLTSGSTGGPTDPGTKPSKPTVRVIKDAFGQPEHTVEWTIYNGEPGTSWELYEDDGSGYKLVYGPADLASTSIPQNGSHKITGKTNGIFKYQVKMINKAGSTTSDEAHIVAGIASKIEISPGTVDIGRQAYQIVQPLQKTTYTLSMLGQATPTFTVSTNNPYVVNPTIAGNVLTLDVLKAGRAGLKIVETKTGEVRHVGLKVKTATGAMPGLPEYLSIGSVGTNVDRDLNFVQDFKAGDQNKWMDVRYVYINGEPDSWDRNMDGWQKWGGNIKGDRAYAYIRENLKLGIIPFFVYYTICGSNESYYTDLKNIQDAAHLGYYFKDLKFMLDIIKSEAKDETVGMIFEPDFIGYMMQNSGKMPKEIYANTKLVYEKAFGGENAVGVLDSKVDVDPETNQPFADNLYGLVSAINYLVDKYNKTQGTNIEYGWQFNLWANPKPGVPAKGLMHKTDEVGITEGRAFINARAYETAAYYMAAGILRFDPTFISIDKYGKDAAAFVGDTNPAGDPANSTWFWNADHWNNYLSYVNVLNQKTKQPVVLWQMPVGHIERSLAEDPYDGGLFDPLTNTKNGAECSYEDSTTTFFFGDTFQPGSTARYSFFSLNEGNDPLVTSTTMNVTWGSHFDAAANSGVIMALFGAGVGEATHGNVSDVSDALKPEDDMWFFVKTQRYMKNPVMLDPNRVPGDPVDPGTGNPGGTTCADKNIDTTTLPTYPDFGPGKNNANQGDRVINNQKVWEAKWWTNTAPTETDQSWFKVCDI